RGAAEGAGSGRHRLLVRRQRRPCADSVCARLSGPVRRPNQTRIATAAVGLITEAEQAEQILTGGQADLIVLARELLRDPYWPIHAAIRLGAAPAVPAQYRRAY
ncbi:MAG TPA: hypothetical protein VHI99_26245, partial [Vicinamibacterales bacterium]|nr:hypothetical protein [Vicinamibacterales bacterium]